MKKLFILGTGGNCTDILETVNTINEARQAPVYEVVGFLDDNREKWGTAYQGVAVLGPLASAKEHPACHFINGIGSSSTYLKKREIIEKTGMPLERFVTIIHPGANISKSATIGRGTVLFQNVTITSNVVVGNHVIILPNSIISHDDVIGDYTCITGGVCISGGVTIGNSCYLGTNCAVRENVTIGDNCLIGMGSIVIEDVESNSVVFGNPAQVIRRTTG